MRISAVARWAVGLAVAAALIGLPASSAWASESIRSYDVQALVAPDGTVTVTEQIAYDYGPAPRRGIIRDIPVQSELPDGSMWLHPVRVDAVTLDGAPVPYDESVDGSLLSIRIGDPDATVTGERTYAITYVVDGALRTMTQADTAEGNPYGFAPGDVELYWDFVGTAWEVRIDRATVVVRGPGAVLAAECFTGAVGSTTPCKDRILGDTAQFRQDNLRAGDALTVAVAYAGSAFPTPPQRMVEAPPLSRSPGRVFPVAAVLAVIALLVPVVAAALTRRRVARVDVPYAPVQYGPPGGLRPAEISVSLDGKLEARAVLATLLDLVARRHITLSSQAGGFLRQSRIDLAWWGNGTDDVQPWEERVLGAVFKGQERAVLQGYDEGFAKAVESAREDLRAQATLAQRYNPGRASVRTAVGVGSGIAFAIACLALMGAIVTGNALLYAGLLPVSAALTVGLLVAAFVVPVRKTLQSAQFEAEVEGFKRLLDTDPGVARRELALRLGLPDYAVYATFLPYAVLFDLEGGWSGAFPDITEEQLHSTGLFLASTAAVHGFMAAGTSTVSSASTVPGSDGGSGFSSGSGFSGGGSAGGGGGGGGGRSW